MDHPITQNYVLLRSSGSVYAFLIQKIGKSGLRIARAITPSLLAQNVRLVCKGQGKSRVEQVVLFAPDVYTNYGAVKAGDWGMLVDLKELWKVTDLEVSMPQDTDYWSAFCTGEWNPKPLRRTGYLWTVQMTLEGKELS